MDHDVLLGGLAVRALGSWKGATPPRCSPQRGGASWRPHWLPRPPPYFPPRSR